MPVSTGERCTLLEVASVVTGSYGTGVIATVRTAKARLSDLLERAAAGEEIIITCDGRPKAKLVGLGQAAAPFRVNRRLLAIRPRKGGRLAEALVREERDSRD